MSLFFANALKTSQQVTSTSSPPGSVISGTHRRLERKCACSEAPGPTGECETCKHKRLRLQPKLTINGPGDRFEEEADRVAESILVGAASTHPQLSSLGRSVAQRKPKAGSGEKASAVPPIVDEVLQSPGEPLDGATRAFLEPRFGHNFGDVRVHRDARAAESAGAVNAIAYTVGCDVVFGAGQYLPASEQGRRLLAHELTHVIQQTGSRPVSRSFSPVARPSVERPFVATRARYGNRFRSRQDDLAERQADHFSARIITGRSLGNFTPVAPVSVLSLAPETWFRGEAEGVPSAPDAGPGRRGVVHDLGEGIYLTDRLEVAEEYAEIRSPDPKLRRVMEGDVDPKKLGRVLDLTEEPDFMTPFKALKKTLPQPSGEPYRNLFENFLKKKGLKLEDFDVIIGPEGVRDGKQMCIRNPKAAAQVKASLVPAKRRSTGGGSGGGGESSGGDGEPSAKPRRRRPARTGGGGGDPGAGEPEAPAPGRSTRRRGPGSFHSPGEAGHPLTVRRAGRDIALGMGAGLALGILQGQIRQKIEKDLADLPKPKVDKRSAAEFLSDPDATAGSKLIDLFNKQLKPFRGELTEFNSGLMEEMNEQLLGLAEKKGKSKGSYQQKLAALKRLEKTLSKYHDQLNIIDGNLDAILEKEEDALKVKEAADGLRKWLQDGFVINWLIHQGFDIDDLEHMDSNLSAISNSITKLFEETRKTKKLVTELMRQEEAMSDTLQKTENEEFRGLFELYAEERRKKEAEMIRGKERPDSPLPEPEPSPFLNPDEKGAYFGLRTEESRLLLQLKKLEENVSKDDLEALKQMREWQQLMRELEQVRKEKKKYEGTPT